jgi:peroxiredoxin
MRDQSAESQTREGREPVAKRLAPGDAAPDYKVFDASGREVALADLWREGPVVLAFLRHFG